MLAVAAPPADACKGMQAAATEAGADGKTAAAKSLPACCQAKLAAKAAGAEAVAADTAAAAEKKDGGCPYARLREAAAHGCEASKDKLAAAKAIDDVGRILCEKCDLKVGDTCRSMFQTADGSTYVLCTHGVSEQLLKLTRHGELDVKVDGHVVTGESGEQVLCIDSFTVGVI